MKGREGERVKEGWGGRERERREGWREGGRREEGGGRREGVWGGWLG